MKKENTTTNQLSVEPLKARLNEISKTIKQKNDYKLSLTKELDSEKSEVKEILSTLNLTEFVGETGTKFYITEIDKTTLNKEDTIKYLKEKGLDRFVHTQEYFDEAELAMAVARKEINAVDLAQFRMEKKEVRLNIK